MQPPTLLEEFSTGLAVMQSDPAIVTLANAKWMGNLISALSESSTRSADISQLTNQYKAIATELLEKIGADSTDMRLLNTALQAIAQPATKELRETGMLNGQWLNDYAETIKKVPAFFKVSSAPVTASTSLGMTLTNHYADLYSMVNEFSFLKDPAATVKWAHNLIDSAAKKAAEQIAPHEDHGSAYQNQLNVNRKLFKSAYRSESKQWVEMLEEHPSTAALYVDGLPTTGVELRFNEQVNSIRELLSLNVPFQGQKITR